MGLLYPFPISEEEKEFAILDNKNQTVTLKSYGLPYLFWIYGVAAFSVIFFMLLGVWSTVETLLYSDDRINQILAYSFLSFVAALFVAVFAFFFYQKVLIRDFKNASFSILHKVAGITFKKIHFSWSPETYFEISHFLDSPNYARLQEGEEMRGFKNKGYFKLEIKNHKKTYFLDRSSNKADLNKIKVLLEKNP